MELIQSLLNKTYNAYETNHMVAGDKVEFEIEIEGDNVELLHTEVPSGKKWELSVQVKVVETDL